MNKCMLILAVALIASPAWADVTISVVDIGDLTGEIRYEVTGEPNTVAAFAIDIAVDAGTIDEVGDFHTGVSVAGDAGYGIFPANFDRFITVNGNGDVDDWGAAGYSPVADAADKGAAGGLGDAAITVELGALYKGDGNAPADTGVLCTIKVSEGCNVTLGGNAIRGAVVLEGAGSPSNVEYVGGPIGPGECLATDAPGYAYWVANGKPECWCLLTQCRGDADGLSHGSPITGYKRVFIPDLDILIEAWNILEAPRGPGIASVEGGICADFDHAEHGSPITGYKRVFIPDLDILIENWNILEPPRGLGTPKDCAGASIDPDTL